MLAAIRILVRMRALMLEIFDFMKETFAACLAHETIIFCVPTTMAFQIGFLISTVFTEIAGEHL